jgi:predicted DNA binding protein
MTYYELAFRLQHRCPYNDFSKAHPSSVISHWCNWSRDVLEIAHGNAPGEGARKEIRKIFRGLGSKIIRQSLASSSVQVVLQHCACDKLPPPTLPVIEKYNCLNLQPMVYTGGWEWYRVMAFSEQDIKKLFRSLEARDCNVEVTSRKSVSEESVHSSLLIPAGSLLSGLTEKQARALVAAIDNGYYNLPRGASAVEIAKRLGIPRTSFVDHLRKGENKLIRTIGPYVRLKPARLPPFIKEPSGVGQSLIPGGSRSRGPGAKEENST